MDWEEQDWGYWGTGRTYWGNLRRECTGELGMGELGDTWGQDWGYWGDGSWGSGGGGSRERKVELGDTGRRDRRVWGYWWAQIGGTGSTRGELGTLWGQGWGDWKEIRGYWETGRTDLQILGALVWGH